MEINSQPQHVEPQHVANGPRGGGGGNAFYDGRGDVVEIFVHYDEHAVTMLQATYEHSGARFRGVRHGTVSAQMASLGYPGGYSTLGETWGYLDVTNPPSW